jgi:hypothetical protein
LPEVLAGGFIDGVEGGVFAADEKKAAFRYDASLRSGNA